MPFTKERFVQALAGFGEGVAGRGQQFTERLDEKRSQAALEDAFTVQQQFLTQTSRVATPAQAISTPIPALPTPVTGTPMAHPLIRTMTSSSLATTT